MKDLKPERAYQLKMTELHHRQCAAPVLRQWQFCRPRVRRSAQDCSLSCGKVSAPRAPLHPLVQPVDQAESPWRPGSDRAKTRSAEKIPADAAVASFPGSTALILL